MTRALDDLQEVYDQIRQQKAAQAEAERVERERVARSRWVLEEILTTLQRIEKKLTPRQSTGESAPRDTSSEAGERSEG